MLLKKKKRKKKDHINSFQTALTKENVVEFLPEHPGGDRILKRFAGKNATKAFWKYHSESVLKKYGDKYKIGTVAEAAKL